MYRSLFIFSFFCCFLCWGCVEEKQFDNTPQGNFEACWKILNDKYCFFSYKDIDWDEVRDRYQERISPVMTRDSLFSVLADMLAELKDGHVNLYTPFDQARYWDWFEDYPENFNETIQKNYLGKNYRIAGGMKYVILPDSVGYVYYGSFNNTVGELNLDYVISYLRNCKGIIFDVRNNGGGALTNVTTLASRFTDDKIVSGYIQHKTGKGHTDFSDLYPMYLESSSRLHYGGIVALLTNRHTFSAANNFVSVMRILPRVTTFGDKTGGGSGLPFSSELPNGWSLRFSASPIYNSQKEHTEFGIDPDVAVGMSPEDEDRGVDTILETAKKFILESTDK